VTTHRGLDARTVPHTQQRAHMPSAIAARVLPRYPPLTLMKPLKEKGVMNTRPCTRHKHKHNIVYGSTTFTIIDVVPHYPGK
jgi:hypothetical protein